MERPIDPQQNEHAEVNMDTLTDRYIAGKQAEGSGGPVAGQTGGTIHGSSAQRLRKVLSMKYTIFLTKMFWVDVILIIQLYRYI